MYDKVQIQIVSVKNGQKYAMNFKRKIDRILDLANEEWVILKKYCENFAKNFIKILGKVYKIFINNLSTFY